MDGRSILAKVDLLGTICRLASSIVLFASAASGCGRQPPEAGDGVLLVASLISPNDVGLEWKDTHKENVAGYVVEWSPDPTGDFTILQFVPPTQTAFVHSDLRPDAPNYYRIRAFYGPSSTPIAVSLSPSLTDAAYAARYSQAEDYSWAIPQMISRETKVAGRSIRAASTVAVAAPTDLAASLVDSTVSGFRLTWTDRASDEEGYLVEVRPGNAPEFRVRAVVGPNIDSFGYALEPPIRKASFRVRAFYFGRPSNVETEVTGARASSMARTSPARG